MARKMRQQPTPSKRTKGDRLALPKNTADSGGNHTTGRSMWSGSISFGLVNIPVKMQPAIKPKTVHFHLVHEKDDARVKRQYICSVEGKPIPDDEIKKAFETARDEHVIVEKEELEALVPHGDRAVNILYFVDYKEIDPAYFDKPYYLMPDPNAKKAYGLLVEALSRTGKAGICQFIIRNREYIGVVRAVGTVISLETMHFDDEVVTVDELEGAPSKAQTNERELKAAMELVESLTTGFEPKKLHDKFRESVLKLIEKKTHHHAPSATKADQKEEPEVIDLMAALQKSLQEAKKHKKVA